MDSIFNIIENIRKKIPSLESSGETLNENTSPHHIKTSIHPEHIVIKDYYDTLVLSGGSKKGNIQLGLLYCFHQKKGDTFIKNINKYYGTSVGSLICLLLNIGFTPLEIFIEVCKSKINPTNDINISNFFINYGFCSSTNFFMDVTNLIYKKLGCIPTLKELYHLTKKDLYITTHNLTENKIVYLHHSTHPTLNCIEAVKMSCNIPIVFEKLKYEGCYYIDGAFSTNGNYPVKYASSFPENKHILGIKVTSNSCKHEDLDLLSYLKKIALITLKEEITDFECENQNLDNIVITIDEGKQPWDLSSNTKEKFSYFSIGYTEGIKLLSVDTTMTLIDSFLNTPVCETTEETLIHIDESLQSLCQPKKTKSD